MGCFSNFSTLIAKIKVMPNLAGSAPEVLLNPRMVMHQRAASGVSIQARRHGVEGGEILAVASHFRKELRCRYSRPNNRLSASAGLAQVGPLRRSAPCARGVWSIVWSEPLAGGWEFGAAEGWGYAFGAGAARSGLRQDGANPVLWASGAFVPLK